MQTGYGYKLTNCVVIVQFKLNSLWIYLNQKVCSYIEHWCIEFLISKYNQILTNCGCETNFAFNSKPNALRNVVFCIINYISIQVKTSHDCNLYTRVESLINRDGCIPLYFVTPVQILVPRHELSRLITLIGIFRCIPKLYQCSKPGNLVVSQSCICVKTQLFLDNWGYVPLYSKVVQVLKTGKFSSIPK